MAGMATGRDHQTSDRHEMLDVAGLATRLGVTERFVRRLVHERRIPFYKVGALLGFDTADVEHWLATHRIDVHPSYRPHRHQAADAHTGRPLPSGTSQTALPNSPLQTRASNAPDRLRHAARESRLASLSNTSLADTSQTLFAGQGRSTQVHDGHQRTPDKVVPNPRNRRSER